MVSSIEAFSCGISPVRFGEQEDIPHFQHQAHMPQLLAQLADTECHVTELLLGEQSTLRMTRAIRRRDIFVGCLLGSFAGRIGVLLLASSSSLLFQQRVHEA